ncbi:MAG: hypothetical protein AAB584_02175 [Patescibacteria group bacterium]
MNCYTVVDGATHLGIALSRDEALRTFLLRLGKNEQSWGDEKTVALAPSSPASHVLVAGRVHLMRSAKLLQVGESSQFVFAKAKHGLKADTTDSRALVFLEFVSTHTSAGYIPASYDSIPVQGFEVLQTGGGLYRMQALVVLEAGQHVGYYDASKKVDYTVTYDFDAQRDRFPLLSCMPTQQFRARQNKKLIAV